MKKPLNFLFCPCLAWLKTGFQSSPVHFRPDLLFSPVFSSKGIKILACHCHWLSVDSSSFSLCCSCYFCSIFFCFIQHIFISVKFSLAKGCKKYELVEKIVDIKVPSPTHIRFQLNIFISVSLPFKRIRRGCKFISMWCKTRQIIKAN